MVSHPSEMEEAKARCDGGSLSTNPRTKPFRKVQIIYYLCGRNGQLQQPHFLEMSNLPNYHPRLKDVKQRLTVLRGAAMPSLYSWSCKRAYKNGYVWNDLSENDVLHPSVDGVAEYILKGSEIIPVTKETPAFLPETKTRGTQLEGEDEEVEEETGSSGLSSGDGSSEGTGASGGGSSGSPERRVPSVLMRMIACGSSVGAKGRVGRPLLGAPPEEHASPVVAGDVGSEEEERKSCSGDRHAESFTGRSGPLIGNSTTDDEERSKRYVFGEPLMEEKKVEEEGGGGGRSVLKGKCMPSRSWMRSTAVTCKK